MKYFKCNKCENIYTFPFVPPVQFMQCGAYAGTKEVSDGYITQDVPVGCGGIMIEIPEDIANDIVDSMRS